MGKWIKLTNDDGYTVALKYIAGYDQFIDAAKPFQVWAPLVTLVGFGEPGTTTVIEGTKTTISSYNYTTTFLQPSDQSFKNYYNALDSAATEHSLRKPNSGKRLIYLTDPPSSNKPTEGPGSGGFLYQEFGSLYGLPAPRYRFIDAYTLLDVHILRISTISKIQTKISGVPPGSVDPGTGLVIPPRDGVSSINASGFEGLLVLATVLEPGFNRLLTSSYNTAPRISFQAFSTDAWEPWTYNESINVPVTSVTTPIPLIDVPPGTIPIVDQNSVSEYLDSTYGQLEELFGPF